MIGRAAQRAHAAAAEALDQHIVGHIQIDGHVDFGEGAQCLGLLHRAGEAVQNISLLAIRVRKAVLDNADDHLVGYQLPLIHVFLGLSAHFSARSDGRTKHVARGDLGNSQPLAHNLSLRALAGPRRA